jgi:hypothetical protein
LREPERKEATWREIMNIFIILFYPTTFMVIKFRRMRPAWRAACRGGVGTECNIFGWETERERGNIGVLVVDGRLILKLNFE